MQRPIFLFIVFVSSSASAFGAAGFCCSRRLRVLSSFALAAYRCQIQAHPSFVWFSAHRSLFPRLLSDTRQAGCEYSVQAVFFRWWSWFIHTWRLTISLSWFRRLWRFSCCCWAPWWPSLECRPISSAARHSDWPGSVDRCLWTFYRNTGSFQSSSGRSVSPSGYRGRSCSRFSWHLPRTEGEIDKPRFWGSSPQWIGRWAPWQCYSNLGFWVRPGQRGWGTAHCIGVFWAPAESCSTSSSRRSSFW